MVNMLILLILCLVGSYICTVLLYGYVFKPRGRTSFEQFVHMLSELEFEGNITGPLIPKYFFFSTILEELIVIGKKYGTHQSENYQELKRGAYTFNNIVIKIAKDKMSSFFQFFLLALMTWAMIMAQYYLLDMHLELKWVVTILFFQLLGFVIYFFTTKYWMKKLICKYELYLLKLYRFKLLLKAQRPLQVCIQESSIWEGACYSREQLQHSVTCLQSRGLPIFNDLELIMNSLWSSFDGSLEALKKNMVVLRVILLFVFFLSAHFIYLFSLISSNLIII